MKNWYLFPLIGESLDQLGYAKHFTQFDLTSRYYHMQIREGDEWKTAFRTWYGYLKYQVISFCLSNLPASFASYINKILAEKFNIFVISYSDNILIYTAKVKYLDSVWCIFKQLKKYFLYINLKIIDFITMKYNFLTTWYLYKRFVGKMSK